MNEAHIPIYDRETRNLENELEEIYAATVLGVIFIRGYLKPYNKKGSQTEAYNRFFYPFSALYEHTHSLPVMKETNRGLIINIEQWIDYDGQLNPAYFRNGLQLFVNYQKVLLEKGVIKLR